LYEQENSMKPAVNVRRFLTYAVLACWIGLTIMTIATAIQWSRTYPTFEVKFQRYLNASKEATARIQENGQQALEAAREGRDLTAELRRSNDHSVAKVEAASEAMTQALNLEQLERKQFWWEFAIWVALTVFGSASFAKRKEGDRNPPVGYP
jgi:hypothetical protein